MFKEKKRGDFHSWLSSRIYRAATGEILDFETGEMVDVETAKSSVFLEHTQRRGAYHKKEQPGLLFQKALDQAKADPNDPFAFSRTKTHLEHGICALEDYSIDFRRVATDLLDFNSKAIGRKMVDMPMSVKRA